MSQVAPSALATSMVAGQAMACPSMPATIMLDWVVSAVERGVALLYSFCRLRIRYERQPAIHQAFLTLGCAILCWRRLHRSETAS